MVDGETEVWYLQMLKRHETHLAVDIKPELPSKKRKKLPDLFDRVVEMAADYVQVFWVVDLDVVLKETKEHKGGGETPLQALRRYRKKLEDQNSNVSVIYNQPCLEYWLLLHLKSKKGLFSGCNEAENLLRQIEPSYDKSEQYFVRQTPDIYARFRPQFPEAISRAREGKFSAEQPNNGLSEMHKLFDFLGIS